MTVATDSFILARCFKALCQLQCQLVNMILLFITQSEAYKCFLQKICFKRFTISRSEHHDSGEISRQNSFRMFQLPCIMYIVVFVSTTCISVITDYNCINVNFFLDECKILRKMSTPLVKICRVYHSKSNLLSGLYAQAKLCTGI